MNSIITVNANPYAQERIKFTDKGIEVPDRVITSVSAARTIYTKLRANHLKRIALYAEISGMIAGNPPYDVGQLQNANLSHIANFNTLEPRSLYERAALAYWNLLFTSESVIHFKFNYPDPQSQHFADLASKHWNTVVRRRWKSFDVNVAVLCAQLVKLGISPIVRPDERSPKWRVVELSKFFVPDQSAADLDLLSMVCIETEMPIVELFQIYREFKGKQDQTDWQIDNLEKFLYWIGNSPMRDTLFPHDTAEMERKVTAGDISFDRIYNETIRLVSLYYVENDGTVSHFIFHRDDTTQGFLFESPSQYQSIADAITIFTQSPGEQFLHSNRGLGHKMYALCQAKMMMDNSLVDMARWAATPILKSPAMLAKEIDEIRFYPGLPTNIGNSEFIQNSTGSNLQGVIFTSQYFSNLLDKNLAFSGDNPGMPDMSQGSLSPSEARMRAFKEFGVLKNQINHFYSTFDTVLEQMVTIMVNSTKADPDYEIFEEWRDLCIEDGIPEELFKPRAPGKLPERWSVQATRSAGAGSQVAQLIGLQELLPIIGGMGKREEVAYRREWIKATLGMEFVQMFMQDSEDPDEVGGGASLAGVENAIMQEGRSPVFSPANDHRSHFAIHMALGQETIQRITQQMVDVVEADKTFNVLIPHLEQHMQVLANSIFTKRFFEQVRKPFEDLVKYAQLNRRNAIRVLQARQKEQIENQEQTQEVMDDQQRKDFVTTNEERRKDFKIEKQAARQDEAADHKAEALRRKTDADVEATLKKANASAEAARAKSANNTPAAPPNGLEPGATPSPFDFEPV